MNRIPVRCTAVIMGRSVCLKEEPPVSASTAATLMTSGPVVSICVCVCVYVCVCVHECVRVIVRANVHTCCVHACVCVCVY